jgi:hypothetical protein
VISTNYSLYTRSSCGPAHIIAEYLAKKIAVSLMRKKGFAKEKKDGERIDSRSNLLSFTSG